MILAANQLELTQTRKLRRNPVLLPGSHGPQANGLIHISPEVLSAEKCFFIKVIHLDLLGFTVSTQEPCLSWLAIWKSGS